MSTDIAGRFLVLSAFRLDAAKQAQTEDLDVRHIGKLRPWSEFETPRWQDDEGAVSEPLVFYKPFQDRRLH
jgi:hypothetical protein